jgi:hypothetical protein
MIEPCWTLVDLHSIDACLNGDPGIIHVASNMAQNLGLETQLADSLTVQPGLHRRSRRSQFELAHVSV